jgi:hypothetical protein
VLLESVLWTTQIENEQMWTTKLAAVQEGANNRNQDFIQSNLAVFMISS